MSKNAFFLFFFIIIIAIGGYVLLRGENEFGRSVFDRAPEEKHVAPIDSVDMMILESFPVQVHVIAHGEFPDGCTKIGKVTTKKVGNSFFVSITSIRPKDADCTQVVIPFDETIPLNAEGLKAGTYGVSVNGVTTQFTLENDNILR